MLKTLPLALALLIPASVQAQAWATHDACAVTSAEIDPQVLPDDLLAELRAKATLLPNPIGRFWRIQSPDGAISHLWGTLHSNNPLVLDLPPILQQRIADARVVALESNPAFSSRQDIQEHQNKPLFRPVDSTYNFDNSGLDPVVIDWIRGRLDGLGWGRDAADYLTLSFIVENLMSDPCNDFAAGIVPDQDSLIQTLGEIGGASIVGLETPNALADHLQDPENQATTLAILAVFGAYLDPQTSTANRASNFALYLQGQTALAREWDRFGLASVYGQEQADLHAQRTDDHLLSQRNRAFLATAQSDLQQGGVFMAIGSFHLPGEQGMIELLRQAGYTVSRIPLPGEIPDTLAGEILK